MRRGRWGGGRGEGGDDDGRDFWRLLAEVRVEELFGRLLPLQGHLWGRSGRVGGAWGGGGIVTSE